MKKDRIPKLLQQNLSNFFNQQMPLSSFGALITITHVQVSPNLSLAKVHLSFMPTSKQVGEAALLAQVELQKHMIKKYLAHELRHKLRSLPELRFYIDNTAKKAVELTQVLSKL